MDRKLINRIIFFVSLSVHKIKCLLLLVSIFLPILVFSQTPELIIHKGHSTQINAVAFSQDFETIISAAGDEILVWDFTLGYEVLRFSPKQEGVTSLAFDEDQLVLYSAGSDGSIKAWDLTSKNQLVSIAAHGYSIIEIALTPDNKTLISGDWKGLVKVWDAATLELKYEIDIHNELLRDLDIHPDGKSFAIANQDRRVSIWDLESGRLSYMLGGGIPHKAKFSESGKYLFIDLHDKIQVWETSNYEKITEYSSSNHELGFLTNGDSIKMMETDIDFSQSKLRFISWDFINNIEQTENFEVDSKGYSMVSNLLNSGGKYSFWTHQNGDFTVLRFEDFKSVKVLGGTAGAIMDVAYDSTHNVLAIAGRNQTSKLFSLNNGAVNSEIKNMWSVMFSPKSRYLAAGNTLFHFPSLKLAASTTLIAKKFGGSGFWSFYSNDVSSNSAGFLSDGNLWAVPYKNGVSIIETATGDTTKSIRYSSKDFEPELVYYQNNLFLSLFDSIYQYDLTDYSLSRSIPTNYIKRPFINHDGSSIIGISHIGIEQISLDTQESSPLKNHGETAPFI